MNNSSKKIAIIGGGIIGLYLAGKLSEQGHEVSVFEKKKESDAGKKVCSALYSERIRNFIPQAEKCIENIIEGCVINFPKKKIKLNFQPKHLVINREQLIGELIILARQAGAKLFFEQEIKSLPEPYDYIIGCDGAGSVVRKLLNLPKPNINLGAQIFIKDKDSSKFVSTEPVQSGFCWKIPRGEWVEYGAMGHPGQIEKDFVNFLKQINIDYSGELFSAAIPQPKFSLRQAGLIFPKQKNITLCGDACGLTKPWSGGGIIWGLTAADILLKTFPDFEEYKRLTVQKFRWPIFKGHLSKQLVYFLGHSCPYILPSDITYDNDFPSLISSLFSLF